MNKKVVIFGGGTGLASLLRGLKKFPLDISAVVSVCDDGRSTGRLRQEFNIPAVGDIRQVLVALSEIEPAVSDLLNYRFKTTSDLDGHTIGNLLLTAATEATGSMSQGIEILSKTLNLSGKVLPLTEDDKITLMGKMENGDIVEGEHLITSHDSQILDVYYKSNPHINKDVIEAIQNADLIILSMGSLFTSIIPNLVSKEVRAEIEKSSAKILYACNMMTQPGETDNFKVSDHVKLLNNYLGKRNVDILLANNGNISYEMQKKYETLEQKDQVIYDEQALKELELEIIAKDFVSIEEGMLRHNNMKVALEIFGTII